MALRVAIVGAAGRLGRVVCDEFATSGHDVVALTRTALDITDGNAVHRVVAEVRPDVVVNCTAYNAVDGAESDSATAFAVNAHGPGLLASAASRVGATLVHFSTDFVFDGTSRTPYLEHDQVNPLSVYGASKLAGEVAVNRATPNHYILRVESLFGGEGVRNHRATIDYIIENLVTGAPVRAVVDRTVTPSYVPEIASTTRLLVERAAPHGTYHCVSSGVTTWYDLAIFLAEQLSVSARIAPLESTQLRTVAPRPQFCALSNAKLRGVGIALPDWQSAVRRHLSQRAVGVAE